MTQSTSRAAAAAALMYVSGSYAPRASDMITQASEGGRSVHAEIRATVGIWRSG